MAGDRASRLAGRSVITGEGVAVRVADGVIQAIEPLTGGDTEALPWIGPGLVDLQVNGYAGVDINGNQDMLERGHLLAQALLREGVTTFLPTVVTASPEMIEQRLHAIAALGCGLPIWREAVAGIHLEGPFISPEDGSRGAHPAAHVRPPDWELLQRWQEAAGGLIRIITLSPEWPGSAGFIARCREAGLLVAIGHTAATPEQIREAVAAGATLSTHFGNGVHPMLPRHPNYLWEQLAADELWASVIADGFHLPEAVLKTVFRVKRERAVLVSDSVALAGMRPGAYESPIGDRVVLTPEGRLHLEADPRLLAGSAQPLRAGVGHLVRSRLADLAEAWSTASIRPAALLGIPQSGGMTPGAPADLVLFDLADGEIGIRTVLKTGRVAVGEPVEERTI